MENEYLRQKEINNLKIGLMSRVTDKKRKKNRKNINRVYSRGSYSHRSSSDDYYTFRNDEISKDFEENIRQILIHDYKWKNGIIARKFGYRDIKINNIVKIIKTNDVVTFDIENKTIKFQLDDNNILYMTDENNNNKMFTSHDEINYINNDLKINIGKFEDVEIDGMFQIENFNISQFDEKEVNILYKNVDDINNFEHAALEIKYSKTNFDELVDQLERDRRVLRKFINNADKKLIYIGIIRTKNFNKRELNKYINNLKKLNCVIIGLNNPIFNKRNIDKFIDWNMLYENENKFINLENKINNLKETIENISEEKIKNIIQENISDALNSFEEKIENIVEQKIGNIIEKKMGDALTVFGKKIEKKMNNFKSKVLKKMNRKQNQIDKKIDSLFRLLNKDNNDETNNNNNKGNNGKNFIGRKRYK